MMQNIASTTARISVSRGRPTRNVAGMCGSISAHSSSVVSLAYRSPSRRCLMRVISVHDILGLRLCWHLDRTTSGWNDSIQFSVSLLTDPPYVVRFRDRSGRTIVGDDRASWILPAFREVYRLLMPDSFCVSFYGWNQAEKFVWAW